MWSFRGSRLCDGEPGSGVNTRRAQSHDNLMERSCGTHTITFSCVSRISRFRPDQIQEGRTTKHTKHTKPRSGSSGDEFPYVQGIFCPEKTRLEQKATKVTKWGSRDFCGQSTTRSQRRGCRGARGASVRGVSSVMRVLRNRFWKVDSDRHGRPLAPGCGSFSGSRWRCLEHVSDRLHDRLDLFCRGRSSHAWRRGERLPRRAGRPSPAGRARRPADSLVGQRNRQPVRVVESSADRLFFLVQPHGAVQVAGGLGSTPGCPGCACSPAGSLSRRQIASSSLSSRMAPSRSPVARRISAWLPRLACSPAGSLSRRQIASSSLSSRMAPSRSPVARRITAWLPRLAGNPAGSLSRRQIASCSLSSRIAPSRSPVACRISAWLPRLRTKPGGVVESSADRLLFLEQPHRPVQVPGVLQDQRLVAQAVMQARRGR